MTSLPVSQCINPSGAILHLLRKWVKIIRSELSLSWENKKREGEKYGAVEQSELELCHLGNADVFKARL